MTDVADTILAQMRDVGISAGTNVVVGTINALGDPGLGNANGGDITITAGGSITAQTLEARSNIDGNGGAISLAANGDISVLDSIFSLAVFGSGNGVL